MIPITKDHPFRTITIGQVGNRPLSKFEQEVLDKYFLLHDDTQAFLTLLEKERIEYTEIEAGLKECKTLFAQLKEEHTAILPLLDYVHGTYKVEPGTDETVMFDTSPLLTVLHHFEGIFLPLHERLKNTLKDDEVHDVLEPKMENDIIAFDQHYFSPTIQDWEKSEIDIVSFDQDFDDYRTVYAKVDTLNQEVNESREKVLETYNALAAQWKEIHPQLEYFFEELRKYDERADPGLN